MFDCIRLFSIAALVSLCLSTVGAATAPNDIDTPGFSAPALIAIGDASIEVGDAVWRAQDGKVYVVQAKGSSATIVDARSPGFNGGFVVSLTDAVIRLDQLVITIPGTPVAVATP